MAVQPRTGERYEHRELFGLYGPRLELGVSENLGSLREEAEGILVGGRAGAAGAGAAGAGAAGAGAAGAGAAGAGAVGAGAAGAALAAGQAAGVCVVSVVGTTTAGKSFILDALASGRIPDGVRPFHLDSAGLANEETHVQVSTSANVHIHHVQGLFGGSAGILVDFEGEDGTNPAVLQRGPQPNAEQTSLRQTQVRRYFPRLAYALSNVVILVVTSDIANAGTTERALEFARSATQGIAQVQYKPLLVIVQNKVVPTDDATDFFDRLFDIEANTALFRSREHGAPYDQLRRSFSDVLYARVPDTLIEDEAGFYNPSVYLDRVVADLRRRLTERAAHETQRLSYRVWLDLATEVVRRVALGEQVVLFNLLHSIMLGRDECLLPLRVALALDESWPVSDARARYESILCVTWRLLAFVQVHVVPIPSEVELRDEHLRVSAWTDAFLANATERLLPRLLELGPCGARCPDADVQNLAANRSGLLCGLTRGTHEARHRTNDRVPAAAFLKNLFGGREYREWLGAFAPVFEADQRFVPSRQEAEQLVREFCAVPTREEALVVFVNGLPAASREMALSLGTLAFVHMRCLVCGEAVPATQSPRARRSTHAAPDGRTRALCEDHALVLTRPSAFGDLARSVGNFSAERVRGTGVIARAQLFLSGHGENQLAVKRLAESTVSASSFVATCRASLAPNDAALVPLQQFHGQQRVLARAWVPETLVDALAQQLSFAQRLSIIDGIVRALEALSRLQLVHGHLVAGNIGLVRAVGAELGVRLVDFGLHALVSADELANTLWRAADVCPEHVVHAAADVYGFGLLVLRILSGDLVIDGGRLRAEARAALDRPGTAGRFCSGNDEHVGMARALLRLGLSCCADARLHRRTIGEVRTVLDAIRSQAGAGAIAPRPNPYAGRCGGVRILVLHGAGTRGVALVHMLRQLAADTGVSRVQELFDVIVGTSTGAPIAIALGVLGLSLDEIEQLYYKLAADVFGNHSLLRRVFAGAWYSDAVLDLLMAEHMGDARMVRGAGCPHVLAVCQASGPGTRAPAPYVFRTANEDGPAAAAAAAATAAAAAAPAVTVGYRGEAGSLCRLAARACFCAPPNFAALRHRTADGGDEVLLADGELGLSAPLNVAVAEAGCLFPGRPIDVLVSLGTGYNPSSEPAAGAEVPLLGQVEEAERLARAMGERGGFPVWLLTPPLAAALQRSDLYRQSDLDMLGEATRTFMINEQACFVSAARCLRAKAVVRLDAADEGGRYALVTRLEQAQPGGVIGAFVQRDRSQPTSAAPASVRIAGRSPGDVCTFGALELGADAPRLVDLVLCLNEGERGWQDGPRRISACAGEMRDGAAAATNEYLQEMAVEIAAQRQRIAELVLRSSHRTDLVTHARESVRENLARFAAFPPPVPDFGDRLGGGAFGDVYGCVWAGGPADTRLAVKRMDATDASYIEAYLQLLVRDEAPAVVLPIYGVYVAGAAVAGGTDQMSIVMPRAENVLLARLLAMSAVNYGRAEAHTIASQLAYAVVRLHARDVAHRDIKPQNIFLHAGRWVLGDFGVAAGAVRRQTVIGTPGYQAPEVMYARSQPYDAKAADVFALGVLLIELHPQPRFDSAAVICGCTTPLQPTLESLQVTIETDLSGMAAWYAELVRACLNVDATRRPTAADVLAALDEHRADR